MGLRFQLLASALSGRCVCVWVCLPWCVCFINDDDEENYIAGSEAHPAPKQCSLPCAQAIASLTLRSCTVTLMQWVEVSDGGWKNCNSRDRIRSRSMRGRGRRHYSVGVHGSESGSQRRCRLTAMAMTRPMSVPIIPIAPAVPPIFPNIAIIRPCLLPI